MWNNLLRRKPSHVRQRIKVGFADHGAFARIVQDAGGTPEQVHTAETQGYILTDDPHFASGVRQRLLRKNIPLTE